MSTDSEFAAIRWRGKEVRVEYQRIAPERSAAPQLVFLHEGLGSIAMWKDFPERLCAAGGFRGLVFSRPGYGRSTPRDADGYYTYAGRSDDMLKVSGIYVSPFEVEATLMQHPAVLEAAVIGKEDADGLTKTKAYVVRKDGQSVGEDELKAFVKERLAPYKYPRFIEFIGELPKTATGKIQRFKLRARAT